MDRILVSPSLTVEPGRRVSDVPAAFVARSLVGDIRSCCGDDPVRAGLLDRLRPFALCVGPLDLLAVGVPELFEALEGLGRLVGRRRLLPFSPSPLLPFSGGGGFREGYRNSRGGVR